MFLTLIFPVINDLQAKKSLKCFLKNIVDFQFYYLHRYFASFVGCFIFSLFGSMQVRIVNFKIC